VDSGTAPGPPPTPAAVLAAGRRLRVDAWTAKVVSAMHGAGIRPVLLKGPAVARWLYPDDLLARSYTDIDLLVAPGQRPAAHQVLRDLGFGERSVILDWEPAHAQVWALSDLRAVVDLHRTLHGMEHLPEQQVWDVVARNPSTCVVRGVPVDIPGPTVRALHLALHLHVRDGLGSQAWTDLERGVRHIDPREWEQAADLARTLGIDADMAVRLRALPAGAALADRLGLPLPGPDRYYAHQAVSRGQAVGDIQSVAFLWAKAGYVGHKLFPPPTFMRGRHRLARRGPFGLAVAYCWRVVFLGARLPRALYQWRRVRRHHRRQHAVG